MSSPAPAASPAGSVTATRWACAGCAARPTQRSEDVRPRTQALRAVMPGIVRSCSRGVLGRRATAGCYALWLWRNGDDVTVIRAAKLHAVGDLRLEDIAEPRMPPEGWSTVAVTSVGLCGSDLHWYAEGGTGEVTLAEPVAPGHEFAGVAMDGPYAGRRVAVDPAIPCGRCEWCRGGHGNLCPLVRFAGHGDLDGGLQERVLWPDELLFPLPDALSDDAGALLEPLGVAIHAVQHAHVRLGQDVLVVGAGPIGVLAGAVARRAGASSVFVAEPLEHRRRSALRFGADAAWAPDRVEVELMAATSGRGADVV